MNFQAVRTSSLFGRAIIGRNFNYLVTPGAAFVFPQQKRLGRAGIFTRLAPGGLQPNAPSPA